MEKQASNTKDEEREPILFSRIIYGFILLSAAVAVASKCELPKDINLPFKPWTVGHPWPEATLFAMALNAFTSAFEKRYKIFLFVGLLFNFAAIISLVLWVKASFSISP